MRYFMTPNWNEHIETYLKSLSINYEKKIAEFSLTVITYYFNGIYLEIEFQNSTYLNKIEVGKENGKFRSNYKIIFHKKKLNNFYVKQNCFEIDSDENYKVEFNEMNKILVSNFLKILLENGWHEKIYEIEEKEYNVEITIKTKSYLISLKSDMEQDVPFLFGSFYRKIEDALYNLNLNGKRKIITKNIEPLKKNIA